MKKHSLYAGRVIRGKCVGWGGYKNAISKDPEETVYIIFGTRCLKFKKTS